MKNKYEGCLVGLAIGDAIGYSVEFSSMDAIRRAYGFAGIQELDVQRSRRGCSICGRGEYKHPIDDHAFTQRGAEALISDDTQMSLAVAHALVRAGPTASSDEAAPFVADAFVDWSRSPPGGHRAPGGACMSGCHRLGAGVHWTVAGGGVEANQGGCGSVMRSAPYGLRYFPDADAAAEAAASHSRMTHGAPLALAASAALASGIVHTLRGEPLLRVADRMQRAAAVHDAVTAGMINDAEHRAMSVINGRESAKEVAARALDRYRGWAGHEAIAAATLCLLLGSISDDEDGPYAATVRLGANSPGDSDSIACIAGALAGAAYGIGAIPRRWVDVIERRDELLDVAASLHKIAGEP
jgi:ADP-ribosylglycohydrolase